MPVQLDFSSAEEQRVKITQQQQAYISNLYRQAAKEVGKLAEKAPRVPSDAIRQQYLRTLQGQIKDQLKGIEGQLNSTIRSSMSSVAKATVTDAKVFLKENGLPIKGAYSHVPADIVLSVASGQLYTGNWTLSRALWLNTKETQKDVQSVIAQGIIQNKSAYAIAKDLEKYVDPSARKDWDWSKVYPGTRKVIDYNAQRLARTMVSHAYQQAFVRTTQRNPFVEKYKWEASNSERVCEICEERNGKLFDKDDLPLDHPNGMCTFTAVMDDLDKIGERLGDWAAGKSDPELDKWAEDLYGKGWQTKKEEIESYGVTGTDITNTWERRPEQFDFEIEDVINAQGFDGLPRVVSADEFDKYVQESSFIAQRTYSASSQEILDSYRDQLYNGKWYVDCSVGGAQYGQGMYVAADYTGTLTDGIISEMKHYGDLGRGKLSSPEALSDARDNFIRAELAKYNGATSYVIASINGIGLTIEQYSIIDEMPTAEYRSAQKIGSEIQRRAQDIRINPVSYTETMTLTSNAKIITYDDLMDLISKDQNFKDMDPGAYAAMKGYDAINAEGHGESGSYTVILNRTKVVLKEDN